ncbi:hypothetical protein LWI28_026180 [Acer negundo]|uniref:Reverse transcriptase RNase H-like domain-containing protein n=1 Tax=Acer negundo TaxID=4023 RepID=A0AAD5IC21_ACENE|nr:hypothetical protein LWI28_026180 [Acer negundo]
MLAIVFVVHKWQPYLLGRHFKIITDHRNLKFFHDQRISSLEQQKWVSKVLGYDYEIIYRQGVENSAADALSREGEYYSYAIYSPLFSSIADIAQEYAHDSDLSLIIERLKSSHQALNFVYDGSLLRHKGRMVVPSSSSWCHKI